MRLHGLRVIGVVRPQPDLDKLVRAARALVREWEVTGYDPTQDEVKNHRRRQS